MDWWKFGCSTGRRRPLALTSPALRPGFGPIPSCTVIHREEVVETAMPVHCADSSIHAGEITWPPAPWLPERACPGHCGLKCPQPPAPDRLPPPHLRPTGPAASEKRSHTASCTILHRLLLLHHLRRCPILRLRRHCPISPSTRCCHTTYTTPTRRGRALRGSTCPNSNPILISRGIRDCRYWHGPDWGGWRVSHFPFTTPPVLLPPPHPVPFVEASSYTRPAIPPIGRAFDRPFTNRTSFPQHNWWHSLTPCGGRATKWRN